MSLDYLPQHLRRRYHQTQLRAAYVQPLRQPDAEETGLSEAEVQYGIRQGILRARISDYAGGQALTKRGGDL